MRLGPLRSYGFPPAHVFDASPVASRSLASTRSSFKTADEAALGQLLLPLGLFRQRAKRLRLFSQQFVDSPPCSDVLYAPRDRQAAYLGPTPVGHLAGVGRYALESWVIFCGGPDAWKRVRPSDKELKKYLEWRWSKEADRQADLAERVEPQSPLVGRS